MGKKSGTEKRRMADQVLVRLPQLTAEAVRRHATAEGLTDAAWVRVALIHHLVGLPEGEARPVARRRRRELPPEDVAALSRASLWLNRHNGAVVQLTAALREGGHAIEHDRAERVLADLERSAARLRKLAGKVEADWEAALE